MKFAHTFWLFGLTAAAAAVPFSQSHCVGRTQSQPQTNVTTSTVIQASPKTTGITITGVN